MRRIFVIGFILLTVQSFDVDALEPCLSGDFCPRDTTDAYPETGLWFDPSEPGSGFMFEIQNRTLAGYYFGYDESGKPAWHLISGQLIVAENESAAWHLETILHSFPAAIAWAARTPTPVPPLTLEPLRCGSTPGTSASSPSMARFGTRYRALHSGVL